MSGVVASDGLRFAVIVNEPLVVRKLIDMLFDLSVDVDQIFPEFILAHRIDNRVILFRNQALSEHELHPKRRAEQFPRVPGNPARLSKQLDSVRQRVGNVHGLALSPERRIRPVGYMVVEDEKVPDIVNLALHLGVEFNDGGFANSLVWKHLDQAGDAALNEVDAG